ncbi:MAG: D-alanine--D-alanine ligase, partial [Candidatus Omnitrophica bacterium]|nr:D-alanine--D-alanine ligase [Candidatus Omnitrophota bacterium]
VLEVNSIPGLTSHSLLPLSAAACGLNFDNLILKMAELAL